jgi:hypothetical protein
MLEQPSQPEYAMVLFNNQVYNQRMEHSLVLPYDYIETTIEGSGQSEKDFLFRDSSVVFITDDVSGMTFANAKNLKRLNFDILFEFKSMEEFDMEGIQQDGRVWRQKKLNGVTVGYMNVHRLQKEKYDSIIDGMISRRKTVTRVSYTVNNYSS